MIVELAETDDLRAPCATNPRTNPVFLHARTSTAALAEVAPPVRLRAPSPGLRPRATRRLRALHLGLHLFRGHPIAYETSLNIATSRLTPRCDVSSEIGRSLTDEGANPIPDAVVCADGGVLEALAARGVSVRDEGPADPH